MLRNSLYTIENHNNEQVTIRLCDHHDVYRGHFPSKPITPGVMTLAMVRECVSLKAGRELQWTSIKNCRFTGMIHPGNLINLTLNTIETNGIVECGSVCCIRS